MKKMIRTILQLGVGFVIGIVGAALLDDWVVEYTSTIGWGWIETGIFVVVLIFGFIIHLILHEVGHLLGGLASGYSFVLFRLFHIIWVKENGKVVRRSQKSEGILGQCLMVPPKGKEYPPYVLYHLSGVLMNMVLMFVASVLAAFLSPSVYSFYFYGFIAVGAFILLTNLLPIWQNDGKNIWQSWRSKEYQKVIAKTLEMYADLVKGYGYTKVAEKIWVNPKEPLTGSNNAFMKSVEANAYISKNQYEKACETLLPLVEEKDELFEAHKIELMGAVLFLLLLTDPDNPKVTEIMESKEYKVIQKLNQAGEKRTLALVEWKVNKDQKKAKEYVHEAKKLVEKSPTLSDQKLEQHVLHHVEMLINETGENEMNK